MRMGRHKDLHRRMGLHMGCQRKDLHMDWLLRTRFEELEQSLIENRHMRLEIIIVLSLGHKKKISWRIYI